MVQKAFALSEKYGCPVLLRPTTRICHGCSVVEIPTECRPRARAEFRRDPRWVIFPRLSYQSHIAIEKRREILSKEFSSSEFNRIEGNSGRVRRGVAAGGVSYAYVKEALAMAQRLWPDFSPEELTLLKIGNPYPFPKELACEFLERTEEI